MGIKLTWLNDIFYSLSVDIPRYSKNMFLKNTLITSLASALILIGGAPVSHAESHIIPTSRVWGSTAAETSIKVSAMRPPLPKTLYIASASNPVDLLSIDSTGDTALLMVGGTSAPGFYEEIRRLSPTRVIILGAAGTGWLESGLQQSVNSEILRVAGADRYETNLLLAKENISPVVYLANGDADLIDAGLAYGTRRGAVILVPPDSAGIRRVKDFLLNAGGKQVYAVGAAKGRILNSGIFSANEFTEITGSDRFDTSLKIASGNCGINTNLVSAYSLSDVLVAGKIQGCVFLANPNPQILQQHVKSLRTSRITVVGGPGAVPDNLVSAAAGNPIPVAPAQSVAVKFSAKPWEDEIAKEDALFAEINQTRLRNGQNPLVRDAHMDDVARVWAQKLAEDSSDQLVHSFGALKYADLMTPGWTRAGENLLGNFDTGPVEYGKTSTQLWMDSPGHRTNLLRHEYTRTGIGVSCYKKSGEHARWCYASNIFGAY